ncbi:uncharacterized protein LOC143765417 isoform X2 [Ranitomeya variabilis]|uniref:uncharacterized protein LOC143765417 isoform X2 n=1 Tax=Ranitomeya variabilis TaxID=490064 RepID=UPI004056BB9E
MYTINQGRTGTKIQPWHLKIHQGPPSHQAGFLIFTIDHQAPKNMSSSESSPSQHLRIEEAEAAEGLSKGDWVGGEMPGAGAQSSAAHSGQRREGPPSSSQSRRRDRRSGQPPSSQRAPDSDGEDGGIDVDRLIEEVREREPLWNMADRSHADQFVTHRLWEQICLNIVDNWEDLEPRQQTRARERVMKRWRSLRDRFKREFKKEMQAPSGSRGRRSQYKYGRALSFLRSTMSSRSTICTTREPAATLDPSGAIPQESATVGHVGRPHPSDPSLTSNPSAPSTSTSAGALLQTSLHEAAGDELAFPLPHPSDAATSRTPLGSGRQRQRGQERSYAPEFLHLNATLQSSIKLFAEQIIAGFNMVNKSIDELSSPVDRLHADVKQLPNLFFQSMLVSMEKLTLDQKMRVMQSCHAAVAKAIAQAPPTPPGVAPTPPHIATVSPTIPFHFQNPSQFPTQSQFQISSSLFPSPFNFTPPPVQPVLPAQPHVSPPPSTTNQPQPSRLSPTIDVVQPSSPSVSISTPQFKDL